MSETTAGSRWSAVVWARLATRPGYLSSFGSKVQPHPSLTLPAHQPLVYKREEPQKTSEKQEKNSEKQEKPQKSRGKTDKKPLKCCLAPSPTSLSLPTRNLSTQKSPHRPLLKHSFPSPHKILFCSKAYE